MTIELTLLRKKDVFKYLNEVPPSDDWFSYDYIDTEVNNKLNKTKGQIAGYEIEKDTKHYVESLNHDSNWLKSITIEIDNFLIDREYIVFFIQMYIQRSKEDNSTTSTQTFIIPRLPHFEKLGLLQFHLYIEAQTLNQFFVCRNCKNNIIIRAADGKALFSYFTHFEDPYGFAEVD